MAANLRRWFGSQLGLARPSKKSGRPRTNLRPVASAVRCATTRCAFEQRLVYERLMAEHVPLAQRRDLKTPAYLRLDLAERFPRVVVAERAGETAGMFGPFRDRRSAASARDALHKRNRLRPCDYAFEPEPALPLGLACLYAQVRSCAAPCLARVSEDEYRQIASETAAQLRDPSQRAAADMAWLPAWVAAADGAALVAERTPEGSLLLFPIREGAVLDAEQRECAEGGLEAALLALSFEAPASPRDDTPWLVAWLREPRRSGAYLVVEVGGKGSNSMLAKAVRAAVNRPG